jgi:restriction system protein
MVEAGGIGLQEAGPRKIQDGAISLLREGASLARRPHHAAADATRPRFGLAHDAETARRGDAFRRPPHNDKDRARFVRTSLPSFQQLMLPTLEGLARRHEETSISGLEEEIVKTLRISSEDRARLLPSGAQTVLSNRLNWARSYLSKAGLIESPRRGHVRATDRGRALLGESPGEIDLAVLERFPEFNAWRSQQKVVAGPDQTPPRESPEEAIASCFEALTSELAREIIERVHAFSPAFFERLIVDLLVRMGYGGGRVEMGRALGRSGDGGVDGVIKEDDLGLDVVYVQAKRLDPDTGVPVREVRDFVGGLEGHRATKGVFVTTSYFPSSAYDFITRVSKRVVLIDGPELARLMIRHRVGVRVKEVYEVKKIDEDYFVE